MSIWVCDRFSVISLPFREISLADVSRVKQLGSLQGAFQPGVLLCMLCVVLWTLCVYKELDCVVRPRSLTLNFGHARPPPTSTYDL